MVWIDWVIVIVMAVSMISGLAQGFFRSACGLAGLVIGLEVASWNYGRVSALLMPIFRVKAISDAVGFHTYRRPGARDFCHYWRSPGKSIQAHRIGLPRGFGRCSFWILSGHSSGNLWESSLSVAFFPETNWLTQARLPQMFFGVCHLSTHTSPAELSRRVRDGLKVLEHDTSGLITPKKS